METSIKIEDLLGPIAADNPSGEDLRYSRVYDQIREARRSDDLLARGEWQTRVKTADWKTAIALCTRTLAHRSKDLQIAAWLTEALLNSEGYAGLAAGLELIVKLMVKYWDTLHPAIDQGDLEYRCGPLSFLNEKLPEAVYQVPVCDPGRTRGYSYFTWMESQAVGLDHDLDENQKKQRQALIDEGKVTGEEFNAAVMAGSIGFYKNRLEQLEQCQANLKVLDDKINAYFFQDPPGLSKLAEAIDACFHLIGKICKDKQKSEIVPEQVIETTIETDRQDTALEPTQASRDDVFECLGPRTKNAICDVSADEEKIWRFALAKAEKGALKSALDHILTAASQAPAAREKNRFLLLLAKLCLAVDRPDLARPMAEQLYDLIDTLKLDQWEHPAWISEVIETLYRCLRADDEGGSERAKKLFEKLCTLNVTKAAAYRLA